MRKNLLLLGAGLLTSAVLAVGIACGDDDDDSNGGTTPSATEPSDTPSTDGLETATESSETPDSDATSEATP